MFISLLKYIFIIWFYRGSYESCATLKGHSNYISAVCVLVSSSQFPLGLILTGGHDHKIFGFLPYTQEPLLTLDGHSGPGIFSINYILSKF